MDYLPSRIEASLKYRYNLYLTKKYILNRNSKYELFNIFKKFYKNPINYFGKLPDLIHLNWVSQWLDYPSFFQSIPDNLPIVWTLHDMAPMTGGCHYTLGCNQYKTKGCKECPQLKVLDSYVNRNWKTFYKSIKNKNIHIVGDSTVITKEASESIVLENAKSFNTINYSIDFDDFFYKEHSCDIIDDYKKDDFIVLLGAYGMDNYRKGIHKFISTFNKYNFGKNLRLVLFGGSKENVNIDNGVRVDILPLLNKQELVKLYSIADIMVVPSVQEAFGLVVIEAMACNTPVIGFNNTGMEDSIINDENGWLIENSDFDALILKIKYLYDNSDLLKSISNKCRNSVINKFTDEEKTSLYLELYNKIL